LLAAFDRLSLDCLLWTAFKIAFALSLAAHTLNCLQHIGLLCEEGIPKIHCPRDIVG